MNGFELIKGLQEISWIKIFLEIFLSNKIFPGSIPLAFITSLK